MMLISELYSNLLVHNKLAESLHFDALKIDESKIDTVMKSLTKVRNVTKRNVLITDICDRKLNIINKLRLSKEIKQIIGILPEVMYIERYNQNHNKCLKKNETKVYSLYRKVLDISDISYKKLGHYLAEISLMEHFFGSDTEIPVVFCSDKRKITKKLSVIQDVYFNNCE